MKRRCRRLTRTLPILLAVGLAAKASDPQKPGLQPEHGAIVSFTIGDPAPVGLSTLVQQADVVALVTILSGDTEHYTDTVYKASVVQAFKGTATSDIIYFGPFVSYGVGSEYVVALRRSDKRLRSLSRKGADGSAPPYDENASYLGIMLLGYSVMDVEYTCALPSCDYAVDVIYSQVTLPAHLSMTPNPGANGAGDHGWVRKRDFLAELSRLVSSKKP